jgi:hypothetical protein
MHNCIAETTIVDDVHAHPHIHRAKDALLVLLVLAGVVKEDTMQKFLALDVGERDYLYLLFTVAAQSGIFCRISALQHGADDILPTWQVLYLLIGVTDILLCEGSHIFIVLYIFIHHPSCNKKD